MSTTATHSKQLLPFSSLGYGAMLLAAEFATTSNLRSLFGIPADESMTVLTPEGEELVPDQHGHYDFGATTTQPPSDTTTPTSTSETSDNDDNDDDTSCNTAPSGPFMVVTEDEIDHGGPIIPRTRQEYARFVARRSAIETAKLDIISRLYQPLHPHLYTLSEVCAASEYLQPLAASYN
jgi:hypothetical protein